MTEAVNPEPQLQTICLLKSTSLSLNIYSSSSFDLNVSSLLRSFLKGKVLDPGIFPDLTPYLGS